MYSFCGTGNLGPDDLRAVRTAIFSVRAKWYDIGVELEISHYTLNAIQTECPSNSASCLTKMLIEWLTSVSPPPTWSSLVQALSSEPVREKLLAKEIRERYCHQDREQATGPAAGGVCEQIEATGHVRMIHVPV